MDWDLPLPPRVCINFRVPYMTRINKWEMQKAMCSPPSQLSVLIMLDMAVMHLPTASEPRLGKLNGYITGWSRGSAVDGLHDRGVAVPSPGRAKNFLFSTSSRLALGPTQPYFQWVPGTFPGVKRPRREAHHSPTSADVKKT
jgi:hypothetical protein